MVNNKKTYGKVLLLVMAILAIIGTQALAATLTKVTGLTSRVTNNVATLTWNKVANATGYEIQIKVAGRQYEKVGEVTRTNVDIKGVVAGTTYNARVRAYQVINGRTIYGDFSNEIKLQSSNSNNNISLGRVTNLKLNKVTESTAEFSWDKVNNATSYEIYVRTGNEVYQSLGVIPNNSVRINKLVAGTRYSVKVRAINGQNVGGFSSEVIFTTNSNNNNNNNNGSLGRVSNLKLNKVTENTAEFSWDKVNNATSYEIYVRTGNEVYQSLGVIPNNSVRINKLVAGTRYSVKVRAINGQNVGGFSSEVIFTTNSNNNNNNNNGSLGRVSNLKLNKVTENTAEFSWDKVNNATSYEIYVRTGNEVYQSLGVISNNSVKVNKLVAGTTYFIKVRAINGQNVGNFSNEVRFITNSNNNNNNGNLGQVTNLKLNNITENTAEFSWDKVNNAISYEIYVRKGNETYQSLGVISNNSVKVNKLVAGTTYFIKVRAINGQNVGNFSNEVRFTTNSNNNNNQTVEKVTNLATTINGKDVKLTWGEVTNAAGYEIQLNVAGTGYTSIGTTYKTYTTLNSLRTGTMYYAKVRAYKTINGQTVYGEYSDEIKFIVNQGGTTVTLDKVISLKADIVGETRLELSWNTVSNAEGYEVYTNEQGNGYTLAGTTTNHRTTINNLKSGVTYGIKVRAYKTVNNQKIYGEYSDEIECKTLSIIVPPTEGLGKVTNLSPKVTGLVATLTWNNVSEAEGYEIYINIPGIGYRSLGTIPSNSVRVVSLAENTTYYAKVRAYKMVNGQTVYGEFSDEVNFISTKQSQTQVEKVTNLKATVTGTEGTLTWNTVSRAAKYEIFIDIPGVGYKSLGTTTSNNVRVVNLVQGITYKVKVRAIEIINGSTVYGEYSDEINLIAK